MEIVRSFVDPLLDMDETYRLARKEAESMGATKMVITLVKNDKREFKSITLKTDGMTYSECVALLEIAKSDVLIKMRS